MPRTPEPEVMDSEQEARDYDAMDHGDVNANFCVDLLALRPRPRSVLDAGTGTALIAIELCRRAPEVRVEAIDLAGPMLTRATRNVERARMGGRIRLARRDATATGMPGAAFDTVMSNSLAHHVPEPLDLFTELFRLVSDGGLLFVRDSGAPRERAARGGPRRALREGSGGRLVVRSGRRARSPARSLRGVASRGADGRRGPREGRAAGDPGLCRAHDERPPLDARARSIVSRA